MARHGAAPRSCVVCVCDMSALSHTSPHTQLSHNQRHTQSSLVTLAARRSLLWSRASSARIWSALGSTPQPTQPQGRHHSRCRRSRRRRRRRMLRQQPRRHQSSSRCRRHDLPQQQQQQQQQQVPSQTRPACVAAKVPDGSSNSSSSWCDTACDAEAGGAGRRWGVWWLCDCVCCPAAGTSLLAAGAAVVACVGAVCWVASHALVDGAGEGTAALR
jgi:hypothetical protein